MAKIFMIDSENVGASWIQLLPALSEQTQAVSRTLTVRQLLALYDWMGELDERISRNPSMALLTGCLAAGSFERIQ